MATRWVWVTVRQQRLWPAYFTRRPPRRRVRVPGKKTVPLTLPNLLRERAFLGDLLSRVRQAKPRQVQTPEYRAWLAKAERRVAWLDAEICRVQELADRKEVA